MSGLLQIPRIMIAAPASCSGKTVVTCALLDLLHAKRKTAAFKCGPDYIDPMFHETVLGLPPRNLDGYLAGDKPLEQVLAEGVRRTGAQIAVIEGVMGYFDGIGGSSVQNSSYEIAVKTRTPVILLVDASGMSLSVMALIKGFLSYVPGGLEGERPVNNGIAGVILNKCSKSVFTALAPRIESVLHVRAIGYVPRSKDADIKSRNLGLMIPQEVKDLKERIHRFADTLNRTLDIGELLKIAGSAPAIRFEDDAYGEKTCRGVNFSSTVCRKPAPAGPMAPVRIAIAQDEAFCFYYSDNLELLQRLGAQLVSFSPIHDEHLPKQICGIYMGGGYPELHLPKLAANRKLRREIRSAVNAGLPCFAECGAYMYLHDKVEDYTGTMHEGVGLIPGTAIRTTSLVRFGYCELTSREYTLLGPAGLKMHAHEFHYWDVRGEDRDGVFHAKKPVSGLEWNCFYSRGNMLAGYPHLYFPGCPQAAEHFVSTCRKFGPMDVGMLVAVEDAREEEDQ